MFKRVLRMSIEEYKQSTPDELREIAKLFRETHKNFFGSGCIERLLLVMAELKEETS